MMEISHRITYNATSDAQHEILDLGLNPIEGGLLNTLLISEQDPRWDDIRRIVRNRRLVDLVQTTFEESELESASWLVLQSAARGGFPMPDRNNGYLDESFDFSLAEPESGIGMVQKGPILLNGIPKVAKSDIFQVFWLEDIFFSKLSVWKDVLSPYGVDSRVVIDWNTGEQLEGICQLVPQTSKTAKLNTESLDKEVFGSGIRYSSPKGGFFPGFAKLPEERIECFLTNEHFGSGASFFRYLIFSNRLYREMRDANVSGCGWIPLQE